MESEGILKGKEYAEQGYTFAVVRDLSKYFDTLNHEILINLLRKNVKDERVVQLIKHYLKSGVMENGVVIDTEKGSPQLVLKPETFRFKISGSSHKFVEVNRWGTSIGVSPQCS